MKRVLAIDYGTKRVGIAVSDLLQKIATPLTVLEVESDNDVIEKIKQLGEVHEIEKIVVGIPRHQKGTPSAMSEQVNSFIHKLQESIHYPLIFWDEWYTTKIAEQTMLEFDVSRKKRRDTRDKIAAAVLLQNYLDNLNLKNQI